MESSRIRVFGTDIDTLAFISVVGTSQVGLAVGADESEAGLAGAAVVLRGAKTVNAGIMTQITSLTASIQIIVCFTNAFIKV